MVPFQGHMQHLGTSWVDSATYQYDDVVDASSAVVSCSRRWLPGSMRCARVWNLMPQELVNCEASGPSLLMHARFTYRIRKPASQTLYMRLTGCVPCSDVHIERCACAGGADVHVLAAGPHDGSPPGQCH